MTLVLPSTCQSVGAPKPLLGRGATSAFPKLNPDTSIPVNSPEPEAGSGSPLKGDRTARGRLGQRLDSFGLLFLQCTHHYGLTLGDRLRAPSEFAQSYTWNPGTSTQFLVRPRSLSTRYFLSSLVAA